jgi:hypothetical protein
MRFIFNQKNIFNQEVFDLVHLNYLHNLEFPPLYQYVTMMKCDYWFILYDEKSNEIIAECSAAFENDNVVVLVVEKYRGKRYSELLLMNVLYHFADKRVLVKICSYLQNEPAYKSYKKVFGEPWRVDETYAYFSLST